MSEEEYKKKLEEQNKNVPVVYWSKKHQACA